MSEIGGQGIKGLESSSTGGEANTGANVGVGIGLIFRDKTGVIINFKSLIAGVGITIINNVNDIELQASSAGEANTISSLGGGTVQLVAGVPKLGVDLRTKSLSVSAPINVTDAADLITLALDPLVNADISGTALIAFSKMAALTANKALATSISGVIIASSVTDTELNLLSGATTLELQANKNANSGYAGLDANARLLLARLPIGTAFQRYRTNSGATAVELFTEKASLAFAIGNGVDVITTGIKKVLRVPVDCEVERWSLLANESGSIVVALTRYTSMANYDSGTKASIDGTDVPDLVSDKGDESTALTGWTTVLNEGDIIEPEVTSITTIKGVTLTLRLNKRG